MFPFVRQTTIICRAIVCVCWIYYILRHTSTLYAAVLYFVRETICWTHTLNFEENKNVDVYFQQATICLLPTSAPALLCLPKPRHLIVCCGSIFIFRYSHVMSSERKCFI